MIIKRIFDLSLAIPGIIILAPLLLIIAIWIKLDSTGPVFFKQERVGRYGKRFQIYKFRTMIKDAEQRGRYFTVAGDNRITRAGIFLRKNKLDELPQLFNVIKGEMSLVGPRPQVAKHIAEYPDGFSAIVLSVPPGITELASLTFIEEEQLLNTDNPEQVYKEQIIPQKLALYVNYVYNRSLRIDLEIIFLTIFGLLILKLSSNYKSWLERCKVATQQPAAKV